MKDIFYKKLLYLTLPMVFQGLMLASVAVADALMLGSVEQNAMSAVSLATQIQFIQNMYLFSVASSCAILGAQYWGKKDLVAIDKIFAIVFRINILVSLVFFIGCVFFPKYLMLIFTNENDLINIGVKYLRIAGWSYLFTGISQCYLSIMKVTDHPDTTAKISATAVIINIFLNAILIYGLFGLPQMSVQGAAIATLIARIIELSICISISFKKDYVRLKPKYVFSIDKILSRDFKKCFLPVLGSGMLWGVGFTSYSAFMGHMGTAAVAANSVAAVIRDLICCMCDGLARGGGILVGNELGAGNLERGKLYGDRVMRIGFLCGGVSALFMFVLTPVITMFIKLDTEATDILKGMMIIMAVYMIGRAVNTIIINGIFYAGGDAIFDFYSLIVSMWCIAVPLAAAGTFFLGWPVLVVYACTCLDEVGKIPWVMVHYKKYKWVKDLTR